MAQKKTINKKTLTAIGSAINKAEKNSYTTIEALEYHKKGIHKLRNDLNYSVIEIANLLVESGIPSTINSLKPMVNKILKDYTPEKSQSDKKEPGKTKKKDDGKPKESLDEIKAKKFEKKKPGFNTDIDGEI